MKKKLMISFSVFILVVVGLLGYVTYSNNQTENRGKEKFYKAISEVISENPELNNPCLGTHVIRWNSYRELDKKSVEEIKEIAKQAPGDC